VLYLRHADSFSYIIIKLQTSYCQKIREDFLKISNKQSESNLNSTACSRIELDRFDKNETIIGGSRKSVNRISIIMSKSVAGESSDMSYSSQTPITATAEELPSAEVAAEEPKKKINFLHDRLLWP